MTLTIAALMGIAGAVVGVLIGGPSGAIVGAMLGVLVGATRARAP